MERYVHSASLAHDPHEDGDLLRQKYHYVHPASHFVSGPFAGKEGRKESLQHPWQPTRLNGWKSVCSLLHSLCSTSCTNQTEEPCEPPARCSTNITSQAIIAGQGSVYAHNQCHKEQSSTQQNKPPSGRALEMLQARPPADCILLKGPLDKTQ